MNVVIYARFSSHSQTEQSIEGQLKECYSYAQRNDYMVVGEYIDRALSGTTDHRPEFQRMIADSSKKTFQGVLVYQLDRFARNRYDSATYKSKLKKNGVRVLSARENISDDASGVLMEAVLEGMAEYYSVELAQKIKRGMDINAEKCLSTGGNVALGFKIEDKRIVIDPITAPVVVKIFEMYVAGSTMADIIRYLNANHIKTSYGNEFNKNSINRILKNKRYIGTYTYRDTEIPDGLPRIVDDDLFREAQRIMEKNKKAPARAKAKVDYLLTTKLFCGHCKAAMTGVSGTSKTEKKYHYYQCVTNRRDKSCNKKTVNKEYIEDVVVQQLREFLTPDNINTIAREVVDLCERESNNGNVKRLQKLLSENEKATENLLKALESGQAVDIIAERITQKKKEHDELSYQLLVETTQHPVPSVRDIRFFLNQFRKGDINDPKYRQGLVDMLVNKIYLYDDKMTILCNTQDGHFDVDLKELSSLKGHLVEQFVVEPLNLGRCQRLQLDGAQRGHDVVCNVAPVVLDRPGLGTAKIVGLPDVEPLPQLHLARLLVDPPVQLRGGLSEFLSGLLLCLGCNRPLFLFPCAGIKASGIACLPVDILFPATADDFPADRSCAGRALLVLLAARHKIGPPFAAQRESTAMIPAMRQ